MAKRKVQIQNKEFGFKQDFADETNFNEYYDDLCTQRLGKESRGNWGNWLSARQHMLKYDPNNIGIVTRNNDYAFIPIVCDCNGGKKIDKMWGRKYIFNREIEMPDGDSKEDSNGDSKEDSLEQAMKQVWSKQ